MPDTRLIRGVGVIGVVVMMGLYWHNQPSATLRSLFVGTLAILALVSPEAVDAFPLGPSK